VRTRTAKTDDLRESRAVHSGNGLDNADWKKVERVLRVARVEWSRIGPTERAKSKTLNKRFNALMDDLAARLAADRKLNKARKETLIKRMEELADSLQNVAAIHRHTRRGHAGQAITVAMENAGASTDSAGLWNTFRAASDRVFARRQALHEALDQERQTNLALKCALCAQIEEYAQLQGDALAQARAVFNKQERFRTHRTHPQAGFSRDSTALSGRLSRL